MTSSAGATETAMRIRAAVQVGVVYIDGNLVAAKGRCACLATIVFNEKRKLGRFFGC